MPTTLGKPFALDWRCQPPHLLDFDVNVWYRFLDHHRPETLKLYYDVLLGCHDMTRESLKDPMLRMWYYNTAKRVDAVIETPDEVWLIEVSNTLAMRAIGQAMSYPILWAQDPLINKMEKSVLVGETMDLDLMGVAGKLGVTVFLV